MTQNQDKKPTVFIVDDDPAIRFAMQALMDSVNVEHEIYSSGDEFLENVDDHRPGCLVLDIRMPGLGGLELQEELIRRGSTLPITHFIRLTRGIMLREAALGEMSGDVLYLAVFAVVAMTAAALRFSKRLD